ncbi:hypothetical protein L1049_008084 [Liquidambar formosana]|uniref:Uncharacterized protein n=1 Tax=Liquidambar formosana TaxID=63359 RepID=A0AAP0S314_LIQFO
MAATAPKWAQKTITLPPQSRGCHLVTPKFDLLSVISLYVVFIRFSLDGHQNFISFMASEEDDTTQHYRKETQ